MKIRRRKFLHLAAGTVALPVISCVAGAQAYPSRSITMIVPYAAGSDTDVIARVVSQSMKTSLGQPIVIENIGAAEGAIGVGRAARARPDGYSIDLGGTSAHVLNGAFNSLQYDLLNDFAPILPMGTSALVLFARKTLPANDLNELIVWLRANSNKACWNILRR
jgi:tripartite-type tricarboxylate transporter receptor subunit TctC